jgi:hypothetical protein
MGPTGQRGPAGIVENWVSYRNFWFDPNSTAIHDADWYMIADIARYLNANPSLELGIDASTSPRATSSRDRQIANGRVASIRNALTTAGVASSRISDGAFGDVNQRRDNQVELFLRTDRRTQEQYRSSGLPILDEPIGAWDPWNVSTNWTPYQRFWFETDQSRVHSADRNKVQSIAQVMRMNPSLRLGFPDRNRLDG